MVDKVKSFTSGDPKDEASVELLGTASHDPEISDLRIQLKTQQLLRRWKLAAITSTSLLVSLLLVVVSIQLHGWSLSDKALVFSPAAGAVEDEIVVFHSNFLGDKTEYQGPPTDEVDAAWEALYDEIGIMKIDKHSAMQLPNKTQPVPGDEEHYIVGLDVFHQLHCLNQLRKTLYPERYGMFSNLTEIEASTLLFHLEHCVDSVRQSLMCSSDISTIYWEWDEKRQKTTANAQTTHQCRNFTKIQEWSRERAFSPDAPFDPQIHVTNAE